MFLFAYNSQEPSGIFIFIIMIFTIQIVKTNLYYNIIAIYMQSQTYHEI